MATPSLADPLLSSDDEAAYDLIDPSTVVKSSSFGLDAAARKAVAEMAGALFSEHLLEQIRKASTQENPEYQEKKEPWEEITSREEQIAELQQLVEAQQKEIELLKFNNDNDKAIRACALVGMKEEVEDIKEEKLAKDDVVPLRLGVSINAVLLTVALVYGAQLTVVAKVMIGCVVAFTSLFMWISCAKMEESYWKLQLRITDLVFNQATAVLRDITPLQTVSSTTDDGLPDAYKPRTLLLKRDNGVFGFELEGAFVGWVDEGPDQSQGLRMGDQIIAIDEVNVETASHKAIVRKIQHAADEIRLVVRYNPERQNDVGTADYR